MLTELQKRCVEITYKKQLTHLAGVLQAVDVIDGIYESKEKNEPFILANGHVALALYVVLEKYYGINAEKLFDKSGTHPTRGTSKYITVSTGSLGHGLGLAVGMALSDRKRNVYVMTSDGDMAEGSSWEALRIAGEQRLENLRVVCLGNGYSGYQKVDTELLDTRMQMFFPSLMVRKNAYAFPDWMQGYEGHYVKLNEQRYKELLNEA